MAKNTHDIATKADFIAFVEALRLDLVKSPDTFENPTLEAFLGALAAWAADSDGYYRNINEPAPPAEAWRYFAEMLAGASVYE